MKEDCNIQEMQYDITKEPIVLDNAFEIVSVEEHKEEVMAALTKDKLEEATSIVYCCDYDSNPYNYHLKCVFSNNEIKADITIYFGVDFVEQYVFDSPISITEYNSFLRNLEVQNIRNVVLGNNGLEGMLVESSFDLSSSFIIMDGRYTSSLYVKKGEVLLFNGVAGKNLSIAKGQLEDSFIEFLPQYMKDAILNPEKFLNDNNFSIPSSCRLDETTDTSINDGNMVTILSLDDEHDDKVIFEEDDSRAEIVEEIIDTLTRDKLEKATSIIYYFDSGSIPDIWSWTCRITVNNSIVNVTLNRIYDKNCSITLIEHTNFIDELAGFDIKKVAQSINGLYIDDIPDGCGASYISVIDGEEVLFETNLYQYSNVIYTFMNLLSPEMRSVVENPGRFVQDLYENSIEIDWGELVNDIDNKGEVLSDNKNFVDYTTDEIILI